MQGLKTDSGFKKNGAVANYNFEKASGGSASQGRGISVICLRK